ncbi:MAG: AI-2E family transporter [Xanthomonadales bacterium]|jgi:predicted PurR-regulated permease PerM|nr:AI-2E family transporter [Xanthomonadales bacterium]
MSSMVLSSTQKWQLLALSGGVGVLIYLLAPVLTPFAAAALLAYLGDPLCDQLEARGFSRTVAVVLVFLAMTLSMVAVVLFLIPLMERQIALLFETLPAMLSWIEQQALPWVESTFGLQPELLRMEYLIEQLRQHWQQAGGIAKTVITGIASSGFAILAWLVNLLLIPVLVFYFLRDWDVMIQRIDELLPRSIESTVARLARESDEVLGAFLRGQLTVMVALGIVYSVGLWLVGIKLAPLIGMTAGLISFVPYLGGIVGVGAALLAALVQFGGEWPYLLGVLAVFAVGQTLEGFVLTPWLVGDKIGMHPVAVIFAIMAGGQLFGFLGVLLALPVAAIVMVLLRYAHQRYLDSGLYQAGQPLSLAEASVGAPSVDAASAAPAAPSPAALADPPADAAEPPRP